MAIIEDNPFDVVKALQAQLTKQTQQQQQFLTALKASDWDKAHTILQSQPSNEIPPMDEEVSVRLLQQQISALRQMQQLRQECGLELETLRKQQRTVRDQHDSGAATLKHWQKMLETMQKNKNEGNALIVEIRQMRTKFQEIQASHEMHSDRLVAAQPAAVAPPPSIEALVVTFVEQPYNTTELNQKLKAVETDLQTYNTHQLTKMLFMLVWKGWFAQAKKLQNHVKKCEAIPSRESVIRTFQDRNARDAVKSADQEVLKRFSSMLEWVDFVDSAVVFPFVDRINQTLNHWKSFQGSNDSYINRRQKALKEKSTDGSDILSIISDSASLRS